MITQDILKNSEVGLYYTDKFDPHVLNNMLNISILQGVKAVKYSQTGCQVHMIL